MTMDWFFDRLANAESRLYFGLALLIASILLLEIFIDYVCKALRGGDE